MSVSFRPRVFLQTSGRRLALLSGLLLLILAQSLNSAEHDSVSWDESQHLYSGLLAWRHADFGVNPEVPPLIKMWCALPLLPRQIVEPPLTGSSSKKRLTSLGKNFLRSMA